jgi:hypothetical protein
MAIVTAMTYPDDDRELPARPVTGELTTRYVPTLDYTQQLVAGIQVNPDTIRPVSARRRPRGKSSTSRKRRRG